MPAPTNDSALATKTLAPVESIDVSVYTVPTGGPEADGTLAWDHTTMVLVEAHAQGVTGLGWTYGSPATAHVITGELNEMVTGCSAFDVPAANERMSRAVRNAGRPGLVAGAISAVDLALWDLKARLLEQPLVSVLGAASPQVPVYGSGGFTTYDDRRLTDQLEGWLRQGFPRAKIKIGESWGADERRDLERAAQARRVLGAGADLLVDANGAYTVKQAVRVARSLADLGVVWFEEPVSSDNLRGLRHVRGMVDCDVAAGEYGYDLPYFAHMIDAEAVDCLQADVTRCGGITVWLRVAALAQAHNLEISGHCAPHAHAHAAAAVPNIRHLEWFHDHTRIEQRFFDGVLDPSGGVIEPGASGAPGLGLTLRDDVDEYRVQ